MTDLERENRDLRARIEALELLLAPTKPAAPRREEASVKITHPVPQVSLPTADECRRLCEIVWQRYPTLRPSRNEEEEFAAGFKAAFQFVQHHGRRAEPDHQRGLGWWVDTARDWISQHRVGGFPIGGAVLVVAIIAAGDVPYTDPEEPGFAIGLQFGGGGAGSGNWWRRVLGGAILDPTPSPYPKAAPSPARAVRNGMA
jgi:hypothetical protein